MLTLMNSTLLLRIASVLTFLHALLHTVGGVFGKPRAGVQEMVASVMKANAFAVPGGAVRTFWQLYIGMGLAVSVFLTLEAVVFWQLGGLLKTDAARPARPLLLTFTVGYLALAAVSTRFFFVAPVVTELLIAACLGWAFWMERKGRGSPPPRKKGTS